MKFFFRIERITNVLLGIVLIVKKVVFLIISIKMQVQCLQFFPAIYLLNFF